MGCVVAPRKTGFPLLSQPREKLVQKTHRPIKQVPILELYDVMLFAVENTSLNVKNEAKKSNSEIIEICFPQH